MTVATCSSSLSAKGVGDGPYASAQKLVCQKRSPSKTKAAIALEQLRWACAAGLPRGVVLMDAGYGTDTDLRTSITALGLSYVAGIQPQTSVWAPGTGPQSPKNWSGQGRPPKLLRRDGKHQPISVKKLAFGLRARCTTSVMAAGRSPQPGHRIMTTVELIPIADIYTDGVGAVEVLGGNVRVIYYTWEGPPGERNKVIVASW
jgi:DDE superfamily endonuclease